MNAAEEIEAAVKKLAQQRNASVAGPWDAWHPRFDFGNSSIDAPSGDPDNPKMPLEGQREDVELVVTLHRTIDAQLDLMADAATQWALIEEPSGWDRTCRASSWGEEWEWEYSRTISLARAINGSS